MSSLQKKSMRRFLFLTLSFIFVATGFYTWHKTSIYDEKTTHMPIVHTLQGAVLDLQNLTRKPKLIQFWATSCTTCLKEMPEMVSLYNDYKNSGFEIIAIAMQYDSPNSLREYTQHYQIPFHVVHDQTGELMQLIPSWLNTNKIYGTPTTFLLAPDGSLTRQYVGLVPFNEVRKILSSWSTTKS